MKHIIIILAIISVFLASRYFVEKFLTKNELLIFVYSAIITNLALSIFGFLIVSVEL